MDIGSQVVKTTYQIDDRDVAVIKQSHDGLLN